jgi:chromosome partition protein MukE
VSSQFASLEEVIQAPAFPAVDLLLRRGRHIDREDGEWYAFITDSQEFLEHFYRRFGCELVTQSDGYFYLLPSGEQLDRRQLSAGEMLVGQTLALHYLDPATVQSGGIVTREQLLSRLAGLIGDRDLAKALEPRRRRFEDERVVHEIIRKRVTEAVRRLAILGFIEPLDQEHWRLRSPLLRFADPVRGLQERGAALERLIAVGQIIELAATDSFADSKRHRAAAESDDDEDPAEEGEKPDDAEIPA